MDANFCNKCGETFEDLKLEHHGHGDISVCPYCGSEDWAPNEDCKDEESHGFDENDHSF